MTAVRPMPSVLMYVYSVCIYSRVSFKIRIGRGRGEHAGVKLEISIRVSD